MLGNKTLNQSISWGSLYLHGIIRLLPELQLMPSLGIDDVSITANGTSPTISVNPSSLRVLVMYLVLALHQVNRLPSGQY